MGNFCTKCGRPLADGEVCNCQAAPQINPAQTTQAEPVQPQVAAPVPPVQPQAAPQGQPYGMPQQPYGMPQQPSQADAFFKDALAAFVGVFKAPVAEGRKLASSDNFMVPGLFILVQAFLAAVFAVLFRIRIQSAIEYFVGDLEFFAVVKIFIGTLFFSVFFSAAHYGIVMAVNAITKNNVNFKQALGVVGARSIVLCPAILVSLVLMLIAPGYGLGLFYLVSIWGMVMTIKATPINNEKSEDLATHLYAAGFVLFTIIAMFIIVKVGAPAYMEGFSLSRLLSF